MTSLTEAADRSTLLTGATGLLGRYLLRDLLLAGFPVCVLARSNARFSAADRIETVVAYWERLHQRSFPRPRILEGSLDQAGLGLSADDAAWLAEHCRQVIHSAASLKFEPDKDGEPERTNLLGTKNLLAVCESARIEEFHHISTAYVAGLRSDCPKENELDVGQTWGNPYESSKCAAEKLVRAGNFKSITIHRPSIIVGDSQTGFTSTFHGFYTPLRLGFAICPKLPATGLASLDFLGTLGLQGGESKNLVPVEWVSAAIVEIVKSPQRNGKTFHLTNPVPVRVAEMHEVFTDVLLPIIGRDASTADNQLVSTMRRSFHEEMRVYQAYWRNDPRFDRTNTEQLLEHLPCPRLDLSRMRRLAQFAVDCNFGWPCEPIIRADATIQESLRPLTKDSIGAVPDGANCFTLNLQITGPGGADWHLRVDNGEICGGGAGLAASPEVTIYMNSQTFHRLASARLQPNQALEQGSVVAFGPWADDSRLLTLLREITMRRETCGAERTSARS